MSLMSPDPDQPSGLLRDLPDSTPPPALDHAILRAARQAPHVRAAAAPAWLRALRDWRNGWPIASVAGTAAAILFAVHLIFGSPDADRQAPPDANAPRAGATATGTATAPQTAAAPAAEAPPVAQATPAVGLAAVRPCPFRVAG